VNLFEAGTLEAKLQTGLSKYLIPHVVKQVRAGSTKDYDENFEG
jgi:hypothetical protein